MHMSICIYDEWGIIDRSYLLGLYFANRQKPHNDRCALCPALVEFLSVLQMPKKRCNHVLAFYHDSSPITVDLLMIKDCLSVISKNEKWHVHMQKRY